MPLGTQLLSLRLPDTARRRASETGFTLIELIVTISIAAILLSIAAPSFQQVVRTNRLAAVTNELSTVLRLARSEAVTRGTTVTVCKSDDLLDDTPTCQSGATWQDGWVLFVDNDRDGTIDTGEATLRVGQPANADVLITTDDFTDFVTFNPNGALVNGRDDDSFDLCIEPDQRRIVFNRIGRLHIESGTCP